MADLKKLAGIGHEAVKKATGKTWSEWLALLDRKGARKLSHAEIVEVLRKHLDSAWWQQMVTVAYEQARGLRSVHQRRDGSGFAANVSKTFDVPLEKLFAAWSDGAQRAQWMKERGLELTGATRDKSIRIADGAGRVVVNFYRTQSGKAQVAIDHGRLASANAVKQAKDSWRGALDDLGAWLAKQG